MCDMMTIIRLCVTFWVGGRGWVLHQIFSGRVQYAEKKKWTQSDLRFCKNAWSKGF